MLPINAENKVISTMPATSSTDPALRMSALRILPLPKTMVLGAVATGNLYPREAASVAGTSNNSG